MNNLQATGEVRDIQRFRARLDKIASISGFEADEIVLQESIIYRTTKASVKATAEGVSPLNAEMIMRSIAQHDVFAISRSGSRVSIFSAPLLEAALHDADNQ